MKIIIGLGNPGSQYEKTRHNLGFLIIDELSNRIGDAPREKKSLESIVDETMVHGEKVILAKPQTFMNASGRAIKKLMDKYGAKEEDLIIVYDDADLDFGVLKSRKNRSSGGHNGIKSILETIGHAGNFDRIRMGIGRADHPDIPLEDWVLGKWNDREQEQLPAFINEATDTILEKL